MSEIDAGHAVRSVRWTFLSYGASKAITLGSTLALARLLTPKDFGIVAIASVVVSIVGILHNLGLAETIVATPELDRSEMGTVLTLMCVASAVLAALVAATSGLVARLFGEPRVHGVLAAMAVVILLNGFNWFYDAVLQRELEFKRRFVAGAAQTVVYAAVAVTTAIITHSVWSIVAGQIGASIAWAIALTASTPIRVTPRLETPAARSLFSRSGGFLTQASVSMVRANADYVAVGELLGAAQLAFYSMAFRLGELPYWAVANPVAQVTFPAFARMRSEGRDPSEPFLRALSVVAAVACPVGIVMSAVAHPLAGGVLGARWSPVAGPLAVLGIWAAVRPVEMTATWMLNSGGHSASVARLAAVLLVPLVAGIVAAASLGDVTAVGWVILGEVVVSLVCSIVLVGRHVGVPARRQWASVSRVAIACAPAWAAAHFLAAWIEPHGAVLALAAGAGAGAVTYVALLEVTAPRLLSGIVRQFVGAGRRRTVRVDP